MFRHPVLFVERLSMFMKLSIGWTIISTVFGFVLFGLVARDLLVEKSKNTKLTSDFQKAQESLTAIQNSNDFKLVKSINADLNESKALLSETIKVYEKIIILPNNHKKLPVFKKRLQTILGFLQSQKNQEARQELDKLSKDLASEKIASDNN